MNNLFFEQLVMINNLRITPSPAWDRGNGLRPQLEIEPPRRGYVIPNHPALARTLAIHDGEEVGFMSLAE